LLVITGATGYLGSALLDALIRKDMRVGVLGRRAPQLSQPPQSGAVEWLHADFANPEADFLDLLEGVSTVVHCAGVAHRRATPAEYQQVNVISTAKLADAASRAGVGHFIYLSSLNVVPASAANPHEAARHLDAPSEPYAASKWAAEQALSACCDGSDMRLSIIRPGLVYDAELTANLRRIASLLSRCPVLLPDVGQRSLLARSDLVALIEGCIRGDCGQAVSQSVIAATDGECYSAQRIARAFLRGFYLPAPPAWVMRTAGGALDWWSDLPPGHSWETLSMEQWCGDLPRITGWQSQLTLETLFNAGACQ